MKPLSVSEQLMYNTIRIESSDGIGTGSFFNFKVGDVTVPIIITNKHVVNDNPNEVVSFFVHITDENGEPQKNVKVQYITKWYFHSKYDFCFCYATPLFEMMRARQHINPYHIGVDESFIYSQSQLEELTAVEELTMVGYPIGLYDKVNNLPIFRRGYTACHPSIDFNEKGIGVIDMACFPGSSGSPIYILNEGLYKPKNKVPYVGNRLVLLGYLFAGPVYSADGKIVIKEIPTSTKVNIKTDVMINLGYYIKVSALEEFRQEVEKKVQETQKKE